MSNFQFCNRRQIKSQLQAEIVASVDINQVANDVYRYNFPKTLLMNRNIQSVTAQEFKKLNIDVILMSPPCQPYTRGGLKKDDKDARSCSLLHFLNLLPKLNTVKYLLLENVKGFEVSQMRDRLVDCLKSCGYVYRELMLSPYDFGIPNSRLRYYLLAKKDNLHFCFEQSSLENILQSKLLPNSVHSELAEKEGKYNTKFGKMCYTLKNILEDGDESKYLIPPHLLQKRAWVLDIRTSDSNGSCCFTKGYGHYLEGTGSVYCPFTDEIIKQKYSKVDSCKNNPDEQLQLLSKLKLRFFSPKEVCRLMCFPEDFKFPQHITDKQKYRLLGNSINIHVVSRLILLLCSENNIINNI
ncbi:tRNA (cytosine(38)-C(5))-methyltransferase isoform X2 [Pseudomyrmex gracilis]|uniref:tRNA (cytosine(38)-C(5))-methyltransferase isoform X2 n=1 Tax=Pseudomyrmex gracilis TaxID=219809 RepID=UPI000994DF48|nr:tRNA (cytosine(38)-C(5))-methyltransferase isoform X2 [Pseudomyrmex gracilis]